MTYLDLDVTSDESVTDPKPKSRYLAGGTAGRVAVLRRVVPARMFDKSIRKLNRMNG